MKNYLNFFRNLDKLEIGVFVVQTVFAVIFAVSSILHASQGSILCIWYLLCFVFVLEDREQFVRVIKIYNEVIDEEYEHIEKLARKFEENENIQKV